MVIVYLRKSSPMRWRLGELCIILTLVRFMFRVPMVSAT